MSIEDTLKDILDRLERIEQQTRPVVSIPSVAVDWTPKTIRCNTVHPQWTTVTGKPVCDCNSH